MQKSRWIDPNRIVWLTGVLAWAGTLSLPYMLNLKGNTLAISNSWFSVVIGGMLWFFLYKGVALQEKRGIAPAGILGFLFSLCMTFGVQLEQGENVEFTDIKLWLSVVVWTLILTLGINGLWQLLYKGELIPKAAAGKKWMAKWEDLSYEKRNLFVFGFLLLCWLPVFLAVYPGFFVYDAQDELIQMQTRSFTTHHPLPHVVLLGGIILAVHKLTGSYNMGIAAYTLFQMAALAGVFTYVIYDMKKRGTRRWLCILTAVYFGLFPVIVMFTLCSAKDGIFTGALLLLLLSLRDLAEKKAAFFKERKAVLLFLLSALVMMSFRHNGMYGFLVLMPFLLVYLKECRKQTAMLLGAVLALYFLVTTGFTAALSASGGESQEMLTVPIQQLARTYHYNSESMTEEEKEILYEILPREALRYYTPKVSDGVKIWFDNESFHTDPLKYGRLWLKLGLRHPFTYINAWFMTSYGFWYPDTVIDVYRGNSVFTFTYEDSSFFGYEVEEPGIRESKIPWLNEWYRRMSLEITQQKVAGVSMLFSPGFLFWVFAFTGGYALYSKKYHLLMPFALLLLIWLTVILGPTCLPRYVLILWFALPGAVAVLVN